MKYLLLILIFLSCKDRPQNTHQTTTKAEVTDTITKHKLQRHILPKESLANPESFQNKYGIGLFISKSTHKDSEIITVNKKNILVDFSKIVSISEVKLAKLEPHSYHNEEGNLSSSEGEIWAHHYLGQTPYPNSLANHLPAL